MVIYIKIIIIPPKKIRLIIRSIQEKVILKIIKPENRDKKIKLKQSVKGVLREIIINIKNNKIIIIIFNIKNYLKYFKLWRLIV